MVSAKFPTRAAIIIVVAIVASLIGFALAVAAIQGQTNKRAAAEFVELMAARLADLHDDLGEIANDYNHWTSAYEAMLAGDLAWIYDNYASTAVNGLVFDGLVLFGQPFPEPLAWSAAMPDTGPAPSFLPPDLLSRIELEVARQPLGERVTYDATTMIDGRLVLITALRTQPEVLDVSARLDPRSFPIAVFTETMDEGDLASLAESLFLDGVSVAPRPTPGLAWLPVTGPDGEDLGVLSWTPPQPGSEIVTTMAPVLIAAGLTFTVLGGLAAWLVRVHAGHLVWEQTEARRIARTDSMTGLANRLAFAEHVAELTRNAAPQAAVLFLDLNGFKRVNDTVGHAGGDALVAEVAQRLGRLSGRGAFLARLGGDEFVFVLSGAEGIAARAGTLTKEVAGVMAEPFFVLGRRLRISVSQGLALRDAPDVSLDELVRRADLAMYRAKHDRTGEARSYTPELDAQACRGREVTDDPMTYPVPA